jgi:apolipoprotein D and lipocalin family protein
MKIQQNIFHSLFIQLMSRERLPRGEVLQAAYGVLDKYKMNRSFFVKTEQENCETLPAPLEAIDTTQPSAVKNAEAEEESDEDISLEDDPTTVRA